MKPASVTLLVSAAVALVGASQASAATNLGATFDPDGCATNTTYIQTVDPTNAYRVPFDGVITGWSYQAASLSPVTVVKLKIGRVDPAADLTTNADVTIVAESQTAAPGAGALISSLTRIPVVTGDRIGEYVDGGNGGCSRADLNYIDHYFNTDVLVGESHTFTQENFQQDIAAVLEPDADRDGFGDESQDQCGTNASTQGPCPPAPVKKKKCKKKKHKHSAEQAKKKCKKKKK